MPVLMLIHCQANANSNLNGNASATTCAYAWAEAAVTVNAGYTECQRYNTIANLVFLLQLM